MAYYQDTAGLWDDIKGAFGTGFDWLKTTSEQATIYDAIKQGQVTLPGGGVAAPGVPAPSPGPVTPDMLAPQSGGGGINAYLPYIAIGGLGLVGLVLLTRRK